MPAFVDIARIRRPADRRAAITEILDGGYTMTDVVLAPQEIQSEIHEVIVGGYRDHGVPRRETTMSRGDRYHLRTVDGEPLGQIRLGPHPAGGTARQMRTREMGGLPNDIFRNFGADFEVDADVAGYLLRQYGYRIARPRYSFRGADLRGEKDAYGQPVIPRDRWRLVEVGSRLEALAQEDGVLASSAKEAPHERSRPKRS